MNDAQYLYTKINALFVHQGFKIASLWFYINTKPKIALVLIKYLMLLVQDLFNRKEQI